MQLFRGGLKRSTMQQFSKLGLCLSYDTTLNALDKFCESFDKAALTTKLNMEKSIGKSLPVLKCKEYFLAEASTGSSSKSSLTSSESEYVPMSGSNSLSESSVEELSSLGESDNGVEPLEPSDSEKSDTVEESYDEMRKYASD